MPGTSFVYHIIRHAQHDLLRGPLSSHTMTSDSSDLVPPLPSISDRGRYFILAAAFLGWMFSGMQMSLMTLAARSATLEFAQRGYLATDRYLSWDNLLVTSWSPERASQAEMSSESTDQLLRKHNPKWF